MNEANQEENPNCFIIMETHNGVEEPVFYDSLDSYEELNREELEF